jgi:hypothetical protein
MQDGKTGGCLEKQRYGGEFLRSGGFEPVLNDMISRP